MEQPQCLTYAEGLHSMSVYLFSFRVSIFYPLHSDTLVFIIHGRHHCLMYAPCKGSHRTHRHQIGMPKPIKRGQERADPDE